jgi:S-adenosylmethionine:tRNA ribosyltransferase-isomerase
MDKQHPQDIRIEDYTYQLPDERVAKYPLEKRDASKLLIYKNGTIQEDIYTNIATHIPPGTLLIFNQTKVIHARLLFKKPTGGAIEVFCLEPDKQYADVQVAMQQRGKVRWQCLIGGASKWKHGIVLHLTNEHPDFILSASIVDRQPGAYTLELAWNNESLTFAEILQAAGKVPLPPYLHREADTSDEERYQTIFAREEGSVAAPTAGLHFTKDILNSLPERDIDKSYVTLHVGAGTFKPVKSDTLQGHEMHAEWIDVTQDTIKQLIAHLDKGIVAVGTTSMRTLESLYWIGSKLVHNQPMDLSGIAVSQWDPYELDGGIAPITALQAIANWLKANRLDKLVTRTQILIAPGYNTRLVKGLITNFHQPQSTLLLLISALVGDNWRDIYNYALGHNYRFLSYGDGCLLWK